MKLRFALVMSFLSAAPVMALPRPDLEVFVASLDLDGGRFVVTDPVNISNRPGYDSQPAFLADRATLIYAAGVGAVPHAVRYHLPSGKTTSIERAVGFSPTPGAKDSTVALVREGRVWLHRMDGAPVRPLIEVTGVGYFAQFDERSFVLFINDENRRIVVHDAKRRQTLNLATRAITPPIVVPGERAATFAGEDDDGRLSLSRVDLNDRRLTRLTSIPFATSGHHAWTPRGTVIMASGGTLHEWDPKAGGEWTAVYRFDEPELQSITRVVINSTGDRIALVSAPSDETMIRNARRFSNEAIAAHDAAGAAEHFTDEVSITRGNGVTIRGRDAARKALEEAFASSSGIRYVREPESIEISTVGPVAAEHGTWRGTWTTTEGAVEMSGVYMAMWKSETTLQATRDWRIHSELFVTLACEGAGCAGAR
ncbi:MAG TPA: DUF4440 domain-containing protein [Thermoanaerobaculia bacterium]|nr:DUF4440 domain-containing protein [Thermoanaerobaculia bacterium]